jgi:uncharacterized protein
VLGVMPIPLPWFVVGPLMGLVIVGFYAVANQHLGISGAYVQMIQKVQGRAIESWRLWFLGGTVGGAAIVAVLGESPQFGLDYGVLGEQLPLAGAAAVIFLGGTLVGFGARWAGACTSGHGITGCATRSRGSFVAMGTFMVTAVAVTLLIHRITGGAI